MSPKDPKAALLEPQPLTSSTFVRLSLAEFFALFGFLSGIAWGASKLYNRLDSLDTRLGAVEARTQRMARAMGIEPEKGAAVPGVVPTSFTAESDSGSDFAPTGECCACPVTLRAGAPIPRCDQTPRNYQGACLTW